MKTLDKITGFFKDEYDHWVLNRLEQQKYETEAELKKWKGLGSDSPRVHDQIEILEEDLTNIRMRLAIRLEKKHGGQNKL